MLKKIGLKEVATLLLLVFIISGSIFSSPQNANAQGATLRLPKIAHNIWKSVSSVAEKIYDNMAATVFKTALSQFLNKMAYDMAVAVATGAPGQKSLIFDDPNYFLNLGDAVMGNAIDEIAQGSGFTNMLGTTSLCQPVDLTAKVDLLLSFKKPAEPPLPRCSLSQIKKSLAESANSFTNSFSLANLSLRFEMGDLEESRNTLRKSLTVEKYLDQSSAIYSNFDTTLRDLENTSDGLSGLIQRIYQKPIAERQAVADGELKNLSEIQTQLILAQNKISQIQEMINDCGPESGNCTEVGATGVCQYFIANPVQMNCSAAISAAQTYHGQFQKLATELTDGMSNLYTGILEKAFTVPDASDPKDIAKAFNPEAHDMGKFFAIKEAKDKNINIKVENEKLLRKISKDCEPKKDPVSGMNVLPASAACGMFNFAMSKSTVNEESYTGILSQALSVFTNTLAGKLMQTWFEKGVANLFDKGKGKNNTSSSDVTAGNLPRGKAAAEEKFLTLLQSNFTAGGPFEVIKELTVCPEKGAGPNNCAIDSDFAQAISERLTVKEAMDKKLLDPKKPFGYVKTSGTLVEPSYLNGYPYRSMIVLRKFRIIPVGWELAAEWIKDPNKNAAKTAYTLQQAVDCYENTGDCIFVKNGQPNPFYHLVDPGWVFLEQPAFCKRQGAGEKILAEEFVCSKPSTKGACSITKAPCDLTSSGTCNNGADGNCEAEGCDEYSRNVYRQEYCADEQTCLAKNDDGSCRFYGYCSLDQPVWKLDGSSCNQEYNSCQTYGNKDGINASYLEHSISTGGCNEGNANCQWYCEEAPLACSGGSKNGEPCSNNNDCMDSKGLVDGVCRPTDLWKCQGKNLIANGGAEVSDSQWTAFSSAFTWNTSFGHESFSSIRAVSSAAEGGFYSKKIPVSPPACRGGINDGDDCSNDSDCSGGVCTPRDTIDASAWVNVDDPSGGSGGIRLRVLDSSDAEIQRAVSEQIYDLDVWKPIHTSITVTNFAAANVVADFISYGAGTAALFDDIGLFRGDRISFDKDVKQCEAKDAGCREFARTTNGANLIFNPSFEIEEKNFSEAPTTGTDWYGWHLKPLSGGTVNRDTAMGKSGKASLKADVPAGPNMILGLETADPRNNLEEDYKLMPEDAYIFSVYAKSAAATCADCLEFVGDCRLGAVNEQSQTFSLTDKWERYSFNYVKNNNDGDYCVFSIRLDPSSTYWLDDAKLEIGGDATNYKDYGSEKIYLNDSRISCDLSEVGCELYTPADGDIGIPAVAKIGDQCPAECVGYETYHEVPSYFDSVEDAAASVVFPNFIPSTAAQCSAQAAGCEEFTNLDTVASGGEAKEYYTYIRQCAKPGTTTEATYYTWEGSEESGFQLRVWKFKAYVDGSPFATDSPLAPPADCDLSNPDCRVFYNQAGIAYYRALSKTVFISSDCQPLRRTIEGSNNDCNSSGGYQWEDTGTVGDNLGVCYYNAISSQGIKCSANDADCREYKGPSANNQTNLFKYDFEDTAQENDWSLGAQSTESVSVGEHSLEVAANPYDTKRDISSLVDKNKTYLIKFWAKPATNNPTLIIAQFDDGLGVLGSLINSDNISLLSDWNSYVLGPLDFTARNPGSVEKLIINANEAFYIDNIELIEAGDDSFVIKNSWKTPASCDLDLQGNISLGYALHCSAYADRAKNTHNLKSFSKLCREDHVGCELLIDTQNTQNPFSEWKSGEYAPADVLTPIVNDEKKYCDGKFKGCQKFGRPQLDSGDSIISWNSIYLINNPDDYKEILCQNSENWCQEYKTPEGGIKYFKDPGQKLCEYKEDIGVGNTVTSGWFIKGQYDKVNPPECLGAIRHCSKPRGESYLFCRQPSDCQPVGKNGLPEDLGTCVAKDTDWAKECPESQNSCTEYKDSLFSLTQGVKDRYYYLANAIDEGKCNGQIDEEQKCVAFNNTENPIMNTRASGTCKADSSKYCTVNGDCPPQTGNPDDVCLMKSNKPFDPQACVRCSTDQVSCDPDPSKPNPCCNVVGVGKIACDANTILYVQKDRDCSEWLSCVSSAKIINAKGEREDVCYDVARCTRIDPVTGACLDQAKDVNYCQATLLGVNCNLGTKTCVSDPSRSCEKDSECAKLCSSDAHCVENVGPCDLGTNTCKNDGARVCIKDYQCLNDQGPCVSDNQTFDSPKLADVPPHIGAVDDLRYRTGFNPYGIHWTPLPLPNERNGEYLETTAMQKGQVILLEDGDFEKQNSAWSRFSTCSGTGTQCVNNSTCLAGDFCDLGAGKCSVTGGNCKKDNECFASDSCGGVCSNNNAIRCRDNKDCSATGTCDYSSPICFVSGGACADAQSKPDHSLCLPGDTCSAPIDFKYERIKVLSGLQALKLGSGESAFQGNYPGATNFNDVKPIFVVGNSQISFSGYINTVDLKGGGIDAARVKIQEFKKRAKPFDSVDKIVMRQEAGKSWSFYAGIFTVGPETESIRILLEVDPGASGSAYFDNFLMLPVLNYQNQSYQIPFLEVYDSSRVNAGTASSPGENPFIGRSCRLYPQTSAPACFYTNEQKQQFSGWRGFCVEPDPNNPLHCLQWLPIDQLQGEVGLGFKTESSYSGKTPLYYCAEMSLWQLRCNAYNQKVWDGNFDQNECPTKSSVDPSCPATYSHGNKCLGSKLSCGISANKREWCQVVGVPGPWAEDKNTDCFWVPYRSCPYGTRDMAKDIKPNLIGRCDKLIEVVDAEGQNIAWTNRIDQKSFKVGTPYGYIYDADQNSPLYGSIFVLAQEDDLPSDWQTTFDKSFITLGGQVRTNNCPSGQACLPSPAKKICSRTKEECTGGIFSCGGWFNFCQPTTECFDGTSFTGTICKGNDLSITKSSSGKYPLWVIPKSEDGAAGAGIDACMASFGGSPMSCNNPYCYNNASAPLSVSPQCQDPTKKSFALNVAKKTRPAATSPADRDKSNDENFIQGAKRLQHLFSKSYSTWVWNVGECNPTDSANICSGTCNGSGASCIDDSYCPIGETCSTNQETGSGCDPLASGYYCSGDSKKSCVNEYDNTNCIGFGSCKYYEPSKDDNCNKPAGKCMPIGGGVCQIAGVKGVDNDAGYVTKVCSATCLGGSCVPTLRCSISDAPCAAVGDLCGAPPGAGGVCASYDRCNNNPATACNPTDDCAKVVGADACPGGTCDPVGWPPVFECVGGVRNGKPCEFTPTCTNNRCVDPNVPLEIKGFCVNNSQCDKLDYNDDGAVDSIETCSAISPRACFPGGYDGDENYTALKECVNDVDCAGTTAYNSCAVFNDRCTVEKIGIGNVLKGSEKAGVYCNNDLPCRSTSSICDSGNNAGKSCGGPVDCPGGGSCIPDDGKCAANWCSDGPLSQLKCAVNADCLAAGVAEYTYVNIGDARSVPPNPNFAQTLWTPAFGKNPAQLCPGNTRPLISIDAVGNPTQDIIKETGEMCGVAPKIIFINKPGDSSVPVDIEIDTGNSVTINFLTSIDAEQRPIRQINVDWGDSLLGQIMVGPYSDGVGLSPKTLDTDPFTFTSSPYTAAGTYTITVMVQDNWNWCNGTANGLGNYGSACDCTPDANSVCTNWIEFPGKIIVK